MIRIEFKAKREQHLPWVVSICFKTWVLTLVLEMMLLSTLTT